MTLSNLLWTFRVFWGGSKRCKHNQPPTQATSRSPALLGLSCKFWSFITNSNVACTYKKIIFLYIRWHPLIFKFFFDQECEVETQSQYFDTIMHSLYRAQCLNVYSKCFRRGIKFCPGYKNASFCIWLSVLNQAVDKKYFVHPVVLFHNVARIGYYSGRRPDNIWVKFFLQS